MSKSIIFSIGLFAVSFFIFCIIQSRFGVSFVIFLLCNRDRRAWKAQRREPKRWHKYYAALFYLLILYPVSLWHTFAVSFVPVFKDFYTRQLWFFDFIPTPILITNSMTLTAAIFVFWWIVFVPMVNFVSRLYFPHSDKARRVANALVRKAQTEVSLRAHIEELGDRIHVHQVDADWVVIKHDLPIPALWFRQHKREISSGANLRITDDREYGEGNIAFKCEYVRDDLAELLSQSGWVENKTFTYFFRYSDKDGEVCKIGRTNNVERTLSACRRWHPEAQLEMFIPESELSESEAHEMFAESRKDGEVFKWEGAVERFVNERKMQMV